MKPFDIYSKYTEINIINFKNILFANKQNNLQVTEKKEALKKMYEKLFWTQLNKRLTCK